MKEVMNANRQLLHNGLGAPILVIVMLTMMVIPLNPMILDMLFTFNISLALVILLACVYVKRPLHFTAFPAVIFMATLLRMALNIASTRVVLLHGYTGTDAAGKVIQAFGEFVIVGNTAVGIVIFSILVIINFFVVTKGTSWISQVSAHFNLESMPSKQMDIDANLNAGLITQKQAYEQRKNVARESGFYGLVDGTGIFVRADAVVCFILLIITIVGGLSVGILEHGMNLSHALQNYTLLTVGDGIVAQVPSLLLSTATALIVTRVSTERKLGTEVLGHLFKNPKALGVSAVVIGTMGLISGMHNLAFLLLASVAGATVFLLSRNRRSQQVAELAPEPVRKTTTQLEPSWDDVIPVDKIGLEIGYRLLPLVNKNEGGQLMMRIKGVRKKLSQEMGFLVPPVHIRDNLDLAPNAYRITLMGVVVGDAELQPGRDLAINPGQVFGSIQGINTSDPAFGLEAVWIDPSQSDQAQSLGYTVVDVSTVAATHLSHILQCHADELLGHEDVQHLLDNLSKVAPKLVENLVPKSLSLGTVLKVLQNLLSEGVPIRDIRTIAETLAEHSPASQDAGVLTAAVRVALGRSIVQQITGLGADLPVMTLDPNLEQLLQQGISGGAEQAAVFEPGLADRLLQSLANHTQHLEAAGHTAILLVSTPIRALLARFVKHSIPSLHVLSFNEVPDNKQIKILSTVGVANAA